MPPGRPETRMICDSSDLADWKNLAAPSDVSLLQALAHRERMALVERLSDGAARQKELADFLGAKSGTVSRWLGDLVRARVISQDREGSHDPYWLVRPELTNQLLDTAAALASELSDAHSERAAWQAEIDRERLAQRRKRA
jgi:DNA-binding IclR family transcriptional regulator